MNHKASEDSALGASSPRLGKRVASAGFLPKNRAEGWLWILVPLLSPGPPPASVPPGLLPAPALCLSPRPATQTVGLSLAAVS